MVVILLCLLGLVVSIFGQDTPTEVDFAAAAESIASELNSPDFVKYERPSGKVEEFIALGDSYTAGTGCNGNQERLAGDAVRGQRSYPMKMSADQDSWGFINGDDILPRFSFIAYTGDKSVDLVTKQLNQGGYKDNTKDLPRGQPFGKPQLAVMTIGGNDAGLSEQVP